MAFNVAGLSAYTNEESTEVFVQKVTLNETGKYARVIPNVKSTFALHLMLTTPIIQDGSSCGFTASGDVQLTDATLTTYACKFEDTLCLRTLEAKWTQKLLTAGQDYSDDDIPAFIMSDLSDRIANLLETYDWTGTTGANYYGGIATVIDTANTFTQANVAAYGTPIAAMSNSNIDEAIDMVTNAVIAKFPVWMTQSNVKWFVPIEWFGYFTQWTLRANYFHMKPESLGNNELPIPGTPWTIVGVIGLAGTTKSYMMEVGDNGNLFMGTDLSGEELRARIWYSNDDDNHKYSFRFRRGWQLAYPSRVIKFSY